VGLESFPKNDLKAKCEQSLLDQVAVRAISPQEGAMEHNSINTPY